MIMGLATLIGAASVIAGLVLSYHAGTAGSASIALVAVATFFVVLIGRELGERFRSSPSPA